MNLPFGSSIVRGYADILNLLATGLNSLFQRSVFPRVAVLCPITAGGDTEDVSGRKYPWEVLRFFRNRSEKSLYKGDNPAESRIIVS